MNGYKQRDAGGNAGESHLKKLEEMSWACGVAA
jgi:hypothetical protein